MRVRMLRDSGRGPPFRSSGENGCLGRIIGPLVFLATAKWLLNRIVPDADSPDEGRHRERSNAGPAQRHRRRRRKRATGVILPILLLAATGLLFRFSFNQERWPRTSNTVAIFLPGLQPSEYRYLKLTVDVAWLKEPGLTCSQKGSVTVSVDESGLPDEARARMNHGGFVLAADNVETEHLLDATGSGGVLHVRRELTKYGSISYIRGGSFGHIGGMLSMKAPLWQTRRGPGSCWLQLPVLTGLGASTHAQFAAQEYYTAMGTPRSKVPSLPDKAVPGRAKTTLFAEGVQDRSDSVPPPDTGSPYQAQWNCSGAVRDVSSPDCSAVAVAKAPWLQQFQQLALLVMGAFIALAVQFAYLAFGRTQ